MSDFDDHIGSNIRSLRQTMSQQQLANKMRRRGYRWTQATVWAIETGGRRLNLNEALDLADLLNVDLDRLIEGALA